MVQEATAQLHRAPERWWASKRVVRDVQSTLRPPASGFAWRVQAPPRGMTVHVHKNLFAPESRPKAASPYLITSTALSQTQLIEARLEGASPMSSGELHVGSTYQSQVNDQKNFIPTNSISDSC